MGVKGLLAHFFSMVTLCPIIKKTQWYKNLFVDIDHQIYPDNTWYRNHDDRNFNIVALGSSGAKWAYDFDNSNVKGMNWANQPQTLVEDYNLLRCYHSILCKGGIVLVTIMPFSGLNKKTGLLDAIKYLKIDTQGEPIQPYLYKEAQRYATYPILFKKSAIKSLIKYILRRENNCNKNENAMLDHNPMSKDQLEEDAKRWISGWKKQFVIADFEAPLTKNNVEGREFRVNLIRKLVDFCSERRYRVVFVIPPVTKHLAQYYTPKFEEIYIYSFLKEIQRDVKTLDYSKRTDLQNDDYYFNSFFMNKRGRSIFTQTILDDLNI